MMNMRNSKRKKIFAAVLAILIVLAMVIPMAMYVFG